MALTKTTIAAGIFSGGIVLSGVAYTGADSLNNIKDMATGLQDRMTQAVADTGFLEDEYSTIKGDYIADTATANTKIAELNNTVVTMNEQIKALETSTDTTAEQTEIQNEVNRLESELQQANTEIADLETYIAQIETDTQYTALDKTTIDSGTAGLDTLISQDALLFDDVTAQSMADNATAMEQALVSYGNVEITDVVMYTVMDSLAYQVTAESEIALQDLAGKSGYLSVEVGTVKEQAVGAEDMYFIVEGQTAHTVTITGTSGNITSK